MSSYLLRGIFSSPQVGTLLNCLVTGFFFSRVVDFEWVNFYMHHTLSADNTGLGIEAYLDVLLIPMMLFR